MILMAVGLMPVPAAEPVLSEPPATWLGVQLAKPDASITAHLPDLPKGMGFVVREVDAGGPAEQAGLAAYDVVWKLGDQMLANESQLAALLRLHSPGQEVVLVGFRGGKAKNFTVTLGKPPERDSTAMAGAIDATLLPDAVESVPMRVVRVSDRVASYTTDEGKVDVTRSAHGYLVRITAADGSTIYQGTMGEDGAISGLSSDWVRRAHALRRGLDHQMAAQLAAVQDPGARVIPSAGTPAGRISESAGP